MELQFQKEEIPCLKPVLRQVEQLEQTQELKIPEGFPGAARVCGAWGQILLRSKQWQDDGASVTGGVQVFVAYEPEDGSPLRRLDAWIPFRLHWDLPEGTPEGRLRVLPRLRSVDARPVSAGKLMVRCSLAALGECWVDMEAAVYRPGPVPEDVELLQWDWPVRLPRETGEKSFDLEQTLTLPPSLPRPERLVYWHMEPAVTEKKVLGDKLVFRGSGNLHLLYRSEGGDFHSWRFELPFHQYVQLEGSFGPEAGADVMAALTRLELEQGEEGQLLLRGGLTGQYLVDDRAILHTLEDAWSPRRELTVHRQQLQLPVLLDSRRETLSGEQSLPMAGEAVVDARFWPDFPRVTREGEENTVALTGLVQVTGRDDRGQLRTCAHRWQGTLPLRAHDQAQVWALPLEPRLHLTEAGEGVTAAIEQPVQLVTTGGEGFSLVSGLTLGEAGTADPGRPSLVLRRAAGDRLWDIARACGSTVGAIRSANGLEGEPEPEQLLLIPVI